MQLMRRTDRPMSSERRAITTFNGKTFDLSKESVEMFLLLMRDVNSVRKHRTPLYRLKERLSEGGIVLNHTPGATFPHFSIVSLLDILKSANQFKQDEHLLG